jgi:hypothetical protein
MSHREYEYMKPSRMPDWMKDFADKEALGKKEGNYIDHINQVLHPESSFTSVEAMVSDLRERVGLDMLTKEASRNWVDDYFKKWPEMKIRAKKYAEAIGKPYDRYIGRHKRTSSRLGRKILNSQIGYPGIPWTPPKKLKPGECETIEGPGFSNTRCRPGKKKQKEAIDLAPFRALLNKGTKLDEYLLKDYEKLTWVVFYANKDIKTANKTLNYLRKIWDENEKRDKTGKAVVDGVLLLMARKAYEKMNKKTSLINNLVKMSNKLDIEGKHKEAAAIDRKILALAKESKEKESKEKESKEKESKESKEGGLEGILDDPQFRDFVQFIDRVVEGRGGNITSMSLEAMMENEMGADMSNSKLKDYIGKKIQEVRDSSPKVDEAGGFFGADIQEADKEANSQMFDMPESNMS